MQHRPDVAPLANWLERWISWLPVYEDREESANCYSFIAQILNGQGFENLNEKLLFLAAQALTTDALEEDPTVCEQIINICRSAKQSNPDGWKLITQAINDRLPEVLRS